MAVFVAVVAVCAAVCAAACAAVATCTGCTAATYCCHLLLPPTAATGTVLHCFFFLPLTFPRLAFSVYSPSERGGMFSTLSVGKNYVLTGEWDGMLRVWPLYQKEPGSSTNADNGFVKYSKDRSGEKKRCVFLRVSL